ncbi:molybdopterin molybdotransferase MoeA [Rubeoparvulum massiliense]|uniref:molybdopterin molybdotransferase MoeA n=1 Tax=Rubeoparvulum massiliense TaxID=1631346 RepID=UPI00065E006D|nr:gephyrin-like molybdotransferase Glp [Rubeoparvulum massiliense]
MFERRKAIPVEEAIERIMQFAKEGEVERVPILQSHHRYLAETLVATHDVPAFDRSPLDGFAIRAEDTLEASSEHPVELKVTETVGAGHLASRPIAKGEAIRIMTGALIPEGCDAVVMFELAKEVEHHGEAYIQVKRQFKSGDSISFQGEDTKKGTVLIEKGRIIDPGIMALLATFGYAEVSVFRKPKVGIYATGTELLEVEEALQPGKIRNSNAYMVAAQVERVGGEPIYYGKLPDQLDTCYTAITKAFDEVDILITTGGVSVGDFDLLPEIYKKMEAEVLFNKVAMRPGSVTTVAQKNGKILYGLSGNPSACYVGFELFARPVIRTMCGSTRPYLCCEKAILGYDNSKPNPFTRFVRSYTWIEDGVLHVGSTGLDKSGAVVSLGETNSLLILPGGTRGFQKGEQVNVLLFHDKGCERLWT